MAAVVVVASLVALAAGLFRPPWLPWPLPGGDLRGLAAPALLAVLALAGATSGALVARRGLHHGRAALAAVLALGPAALAQAAGGPASPWYVAALPGLAVAALWTSAPRALALAAGLALAEVAAAAVHGAGRAGVLAVAPQATAGLLATACLAALRGNGARRQPAPAGCEPAAPAGTSDARTDVPEADRALRRILGEVLASQGPDAVVFVAQADDPGSVEVRMALPGDAPVDRTGRYARDEEAVFRWLWGRRRAISIPQIVPGFRRVPFLLADAAVRSFLGVPVLQDGRVVGALCVVSRTAGAFGHEQERLLAFAAQQVAESLGQARRLSATSRLAREFETLYRAMAGLTATLDPPEVMARVLEAARSIAAYDHAALLLADETGAHVRVGATAPAAPGDRAAAGDPPLPLAGTRLAAALAHRLPVVFGTARERRTGRPLLPRGLRLRAGQSTLVVPLVEGGRAAGALVIAADRPGAFRAEAVRLLEILATHAAVVLGRARQFKQTEAMANTDPLTGLLNRRRFGERLADELARARRSPGPFSLVLADLDHFKRVNDSHGHPAGDAVLVELARRLARRARASDTVARLGGEEFGLILVQAGRAGAAAVAERVREDVRRAPFAVGDGVEVRLTLSLGVAVFPDDAADPEGLMARADEALYAAKRAGRDRVQASPPAPEAGPTARAEPAGPAACRDASHEGPPGDPAAPGRAPAARS